MSSGPGDTAFSYPSSVGWVNSIDDALQIAKIKNKPIAVYISSKEEFKVVGESAEEIKLYAAANANSVPSTVFDLPKIVNHLRGLGVVEFAKLANSKENRALVNKYEASSYMMVVLAPDGSRIDGGSIVGSNLNSTAISTKEKITEWRARQPK